MFIITSACVHLWQRHSSSLKAKNKAKQFAVHEPAKARQPRTAPAPKVTSDSQARPAAHSSALTSTKPRFADSAQPRFPAKNADTEQISAAVRAGRADELPQMLEAATARFAERNNNPQQCEFYAANLLLCALKACASAQRYIDALSAYDSVATKIGKGNQNIWSLLLYACVQTSKFGHGSELFSRLCSRGAPSGHDIVNVIKCKAETHDEPGLIQLLADLSKAKVWMDNMTRNRSIASCTASRSMSMAAILMGSDVYGEDLDSIAYNTLMKGYIRVGQYSKVFDLLAEMKDKQLRPSEVTFGILLDACFCIKDFERAQSIFQDLKSSGLKVNAVHYTSLIKGLVAAGRLEQANEVFLDMHQSGDVKPDLITFSTLVKAHSDKGDAASALDTFNLMLQSGVQPDDIVLRNIFLTRNGLSSMQVTDMYESMLENGLKLHAATLAVVVKAFMQANAYKEAVKLLESAPSRFRVKLDARLCQQLVQACVRNDLREEHKRACALLAQAS